MQIILLSGGSGKRLWPLSNDIRSKQFLKLFPQVDGGHLSMIQRVYRQIRRALPEAGVTVATSRAQVSTLQHQLGLDIDISVEPCRRDTFPAIVLVNAYLHDVKHVPLDAAVAVCPVDPYVDASFFSAVGELAELAEAQAANLLLMGIEPTYPSEKYGYILPESSERVSRVSAFHEKPDARTAEAYIAHGALWNSGVFAYRLGYVLEKAHRLLDFEGYEDLYAHYADLKKISFDYAVAEQERSIRVLRYAGEWRDLGTWNTLTEVMQEHAVGDATLDETCHNVHVVNEMDVPVLCMGLNNAVVAASPEGILVADKHASSFIKPYVEQFDQQIRFAEKSWGYFQVIDIERESLTIKVTLNAGHAMHYHRHQHRDEVWTVVEGQGRALVDGVWRDVHAGDIIALSRGCRHKLAATTKLVAIEVQMGADITVEDKVVEAE